MITKGHIVLSLRSLDTAYQQAKSDQDAERFAKLAIIELCGWIEEVMDEIVLRCGRRHLKSSRNKETWEKEVSITHGFDYNKHFRGMLIKLVGLIGVERVENSVDQVKLVQLKSTLGDLKVVRDSVAHTHLKGVTKTLNAPSVTIRSFQRVYDGLTEFDRVMRRSGW